MSRARAHTHKLSLSKRRWEESVARGWHGRKGGGGGEEGERQGRTSPYAPATRRKKKEVRKKEKKKKEKKKRKRKKKKKGTKTKEKLQERQHWPVHMPLPTRGKKEEQYLEDSLTKGVTDAEGCVCLYMCPYMCPYVSLYVTWRTA